MIKATVGQLMINDALPEELRKPDRMLDSKGIAALFQEIAEKYPDQYKDVAHKLTKLGHEFAYSKGGFSFGIRNLLPAKAALKARGEIKEGMTKILQDPNLDAKARNNAIVKLVDSKRKELDESIYDESLSEDNPLALQVKTGVRGNKTNLRTLRGGDLLYADHRDRTIPFPVLNSYSEGLTPAEYWAGAFGARKGVVDLKRGTAEAGYLCHAKGTLVRMGDGSTKTIEEIKVGDTVLGADRTGHTFPIRVSATFDNGEREVFRYRFREGRNLIHVDATPDHKVLAILRRGLVIERNLRPDKTPLRRVNSGFEIVVAGGATRGFHSEYSLGRLPTYDIEVAHRDHLFVLANGIITSNSKVMNQVAHRLVVTGRDAPDSDGDATIRGLPVDTDDPDNVGSLLAHPIGGYARNTPLTAKVLKHLQDQDFKNILVRSPITGGPKDGGVYARDVGVREKGGLPPIGDYVGLAASQALSEKTTQASISSKHTGGVAGAGGAAQGYKAIEKLINPPKIYPGAATHAQEDGVVQGIAEAPQGGHYVTVGNHKHYVPTGADVTVKKGDTIEAGDMLSSGIPNHTEIVKHKGIGEGRRYFTNTFRDVYKNTGLGVSRRNVEILARGLIDHVRLNEEYGSYVAGDVVPYSLLERNWSPRDGSAKGTPDQFLGQYLESPVLHHTIGTRITPSVVKQLQQYGVKEISAHREKPPFQAEVQRGLTQAQHDPDWMTRHYGSGLSKGMMNAAQRGSTSDPQGTSFVSALGLNPIEFGNTGKTVGWNPKAVDKDPLLD